LAGRLRERNQVELLIEKMQPSWLEGRSRWGYRLLQRIGGRYRFIHRELLDYFAGAESHQR
jgi:hypothetical protein